MVMYLYRNRVDNIKRESVNNGGFLLASDTHGNASLYNVFIAV